MPDSIKEQILDRLDATAFAALLSNGTVKSVERSGRQSAVFHQLPALIYRSGAEDTLNQGLAVGTGNAIWIIRFTVTITVFFNAPQTPGIEKENILGEVQKQLELDQTLGGLGRIIECAEDAATPPLALLSPAAALTLKVRIQYNRKIGDPYSAI